MIGSLFLSVSPQMLLCILLLLKSRTPAPACTCWNTVSCFLDFSVPVFVFQEDGARSGGF